MPALCAGIPLHTFNLNRADYLKVVVEEADGVYVGGDLVSADFAGLK